MFKLVVFFALVAVAVAKPSLSHETVQYVAAPAVTKTIVAPAAVSHTYREDIINKPAAVAYAAIPTYAYAAPVVAKTVVAEPVAVATPVVAKAAPVVTKTVVAPAAVSHTYREDIISKPAAVAYAAPLAPQPLAVAAPVVGKTVVAEPAPAVAKTVVAEPVAVPAPVVTKTVVTPAAVSQTYREDVISKPATVAYAAPAVAYAAPAVAYAAPAVSYASPAVAYAAPAVAYATPVVQKTVGYAAPVAYAPGVQAW